MNVRVIAVMLTVASAAAAVGGMYRSTSDKVEDLSDRMRGVESAVRAPRYTRSDAMADIRRHERQGEAQLARIDKLLDNQAALNREIIAHMARTTQALAEIRSIVTRGGPAE